MSLSTGESLPGFTAVSTFRAASAGVYEFVFRPEAKSGGTTDGSLASYRLEGACGGPRGARLYMPHVVGGPAGLNVTQIVGDTTPFAVNPAGAVSPVVVFRVYMEAGEVFSCSAALIGRYFLGAGSIVERGAAGYWLAVSSLYVP